MSSEQAEQLTLGAEMIKRASHITGYDVTAFRIVFTRSPILLFHILALNEAMIKRGISLLNRIELLRETPSYRPPRFHKDPFFLGLVKFYAETETP